MRIDDAALTVLDTETGGLDPTCDLLEIAAHQIPGERHFATLVRPTKPILSPAATSRAPSAIGGTNVPRWA